MTLSQRMISNVSLNWLCTEYEIFRFPNHLFGSAHMQNLSVDDGLNWGLILPQCHCALTHKTNMQKRGFNRPLLSFLFPSKIIFCETKTEIVWNWIARLFCLNKISYFNNKKLTKSVAYLFVNNWYENPRVVFVWFFKHHEKSETYESKTHHF